MINWLGLGALPGALLGTKATERPLSIRSHPRRGVVLPFPVRQPTVSVVIPTLDEEKNLPHVLGRLPGTVTELIIVDGGSSDATVEVARALRPDALILRQTGRGKGNALCCGFKAARGDVIVMLDADGSTDPAEIPLFVDALLAGADFAKGSRFMPGGGSSDITPLRRAGNAALSGTVNILFRTHYTDLCYGYNAFWRRCLDDLAIDCSGFEVETLLNVRVARASLAVTEVPSFEHERLHGLSKLHAFRDGMRILRTIVREWVSHRRRPVTAPQARETMVDGRIFGNLPDLDDGVVMTGG